MPALEFFCARDVVREILCGVSSFARRILSNETKVESDFFIEFEGIFEFFFGLLREANNNVCRDRDVGARSAEGIYDFNVAFRCVWAVHSFQAIVIAGLDRQVNVRHEGF